jgi:hypothetical protein
MMTTRKKKRAREHCVELITLHAKIHECGTCIAAAATTATRSHAGFLKDSRFNNQMMNN